MAGDVLTTATAGADETARIGEAADPAQQNGTQQNGTQRGVEGRDSDPDRATAAEPEPVMPGNLQLPARSQEPETQAARHGNVRPARETRGSRPRRSPSRQVPAYAAAWQGSEHSGGPV